MKSYVLPIIMIVLILVIVLGLPGQDDVFQKSAAEVMEILDHDHVIIPDQLNTLKKGGELILVDLDPEDRFSEYHLAGAVNFPVSGMDTKSIHEFFSQTATYVLYAEEISIACKTLVLFAQMGIENVMVLDASPRPADD